MSIGKNGIWIADNIYESSAMNIHYNNEIGDCDNKIYSFTPWVDDNMCMRDIKVHGELYPANELMHVRFKVTWNGFDTSNTSGTFDIHFQGYYTNNGSKIYATPLGSAATNYRDLRGLVLSSISGEFYYDFTFNNLPYVTNEGIRSNYSNGTATITFSEFTVIPEKYYVPKNKGGVLLSTSEKIIFQQEKYTKSKLPKGGDLV